MLRSLSAAMHGSPGSWGDGYFNLMVSGVVWDRLRPVGTERVPEVNVV